jgi:pimeloyl-ACP methyl ester carboxylesterase
MNLEEVQYGGELRRTHAGDSTSRGGRTMLLTTSVGVAFLGLLLLAAPAYAQTPGKNLTQKETSVTQLDAQSKQVVSQYTAPNRTIEAANGTTYAYRRFGKAGTIPLVFLQHFRGNLDNWDPALVDDIAAEREVILVDYSGVGLSTGTTPRTVQGLARDVLAFVDALGLKKVDLFGFSLGGFVAQDIVLLRPRLVRRLILAGTGPQGGRDMHGWNEEISEHVYKDVQGSDDIYYLFFAPTETSQVKAREFVGRIFTRKLDRDETPALAVRDAQAEAITDWGIPDVSKLARLAAITQPTLVANGDHDIMVPTVNSYLLAGHIPNAELIIYPDANHGFLFQYPHEFASKVNKFLTAAQGE